MKRHRVEFAPEAVRQARQVEQWWRSNRPAAPALLMEELTAAVELVSASPGAGVLYRRSFVSGMRRILLPRTRYHLYYTADEAEGVVRIHALWHTARGQGPAL